MLKNFIAGYMIMMVLTGCLKGSSETTVTCNATYDSCSVVAPASEIQAVKDYLAANNIAATQHCSGLFYSIDADGTGPRPTVCSNIAVTYEGRLTDGTVFDRADNPIALSLDQVIRGWKNGVPLIRQGGTIHLYIPPSLGYGNYLVGSIPPNSILIFRVDLVSVQ